MLRSERLARTERYIARQVRLARLVGYEPSQPHRLAKWNAVNCGQRGCPYCGNPRRKRGELTMQEKRLMQRADDGDIGNPISEQDQ